MASPRRLRSFSCAMALAVLLNVAAPDHWDVPNPLDAVVNGEHTHPAERAAHEAEPEHARHCHGDAATCSDLPLMSVGGFIALAALLAFGGLMLAGRSVSLAATRLPGWTSAPLLPPPRLLAGTRI